MYKGVRFNKDCILDVRTHFKPTETFQNTNFYSCHPPGVIKGFIKAEALRLLRTNSSEITFEENMRNFSTRLKNRDYPATSAEKHLSEVIFADRKKALSKRNKNSSKKILPFVTQYHPALLNQEHTHEEMADLIQNQPHLRNIFKEPPLISYRKGKSLKDILVRAKDQPIYELQESCRPFNTFKLFKTCNLQPATCNLQPATCDLQPATCKLHPPPQ